MQKYVIFIKSDDSKVFPKESVTYLLIRELKQKWFRKHHIEIDAENEKEAINKLNEFSNGYLNSLKEISGGAVICGVSVIITALIYFFRS